MEIAALYDYKVGEHGLVSFYAAPVGDPAMGPPAFEHRVTASEDPLASPGTIICKTQPLLRMTL